MRLHELKRALNETLGQNKAVVVYSHFNPVTDKEIAIIKEAREQAQRLGADLVVCSTGLVNESYPLSFETKSRLLNDVFPSIQLEQVSSVGQLLEGMAAPANVDRFNTIDIYVDSEMEHNVNILMAEQECPCNVHGFTGNNTQRKSILENINTVKPIVPRGTNDKSGYVSWVQSAGMMLNESVRVRTAFKAGDTVEHIGNGDKATILGESGNLVMCESLLNNTLETYHYQDLVNMSSVFEPCYYDIIIENVMESTMNASGITFNNDEIAANLTPKQKSAIRSAGVNSYLILASDKGATQFDVTGEVMEGGKWTRITFTAPQLRISGYFTIIIGKQGGVLGKPYIAHARA